MRFSLVRVLVIAFGALLFGFALPSVVASCSETFYDRQVRGKLPPAALLEFERYDSACRQLRDDRNKLALEVSSMLKSSDQLDGTQLRDLLNAQVMMDEALRTADPPIRVVGLYLSTLWFVWPIHFLALGLLAFTVSPLSRVSIWVRLHRARWLIPVVLIAFHWPTWLRNIFFREEGRVTYAYANLDVSGPGFVCQEAQILVTCVLIAVMWRDWLTLTHVRGVVGAVEHRAAQEHPLMVAFRPERYARLARSFGQWILSSVLVLITFGGFTVHFWRSIASNGDLRYLLHAFVLHGFWLATWVIVSLPFLREWVLWDKLRHLATVRLADRAEDGRAKDAFNVLALQPPIRMWLVAASAAIGTATMVLPALRTLLSL